MSVTGAKNKAQARWRKLLGNQKHNGLLRKETPTILRQASWISATKQSSKVTNSLKNGSSSTKTQEKVEKNCMKRLRISAKQHRKKPR